MTTSAAALLKSVRELPPFPAVAMRVIALVNDDSVRMNQLAEVLGTDQALTAKLLRICNSAAVGYNREVSTVERAVVVLGLNQVRQLAFVTSVTSTFGRTSRIEDGFDVDGYWQHNLEVALASESVARSVEGVNPAEAFAAGIMHDIGRLVMRLVRPAEFAAAMRMVEQDGVSVADAELTQIGFRHEEVGGAFAELWRFPRPMVHAIARHHAPPASLQGIDLAGVVALCDDLALSHSLPTSADGHPSSSLHTLVDRLCGGWEKITERATTMRAAIDGADHPRGQHPRVA